MNKVDFLLSSPFQTLSEQEKLVIIQLGPDQPDVCLVQKHKTQSRSFNKDWYIRKQWLTASESKKSLFCFNCLLFGGDDAWTVHGVSDLKHLSERIKSHEISSSHIGSSLKLRMYGKVDIRIQIDEGHRLSVTRHNELVRKNRHILNRVVDCLKFCGKHEIALCEYAEKQESLNRGIFLDLINEISKLDITLLEHLKESEVNKYTSVMIQKELLDCMYQVYQENLIEDVNKARFLSVQADEISGSTNEARLVIVLRYVQGLQVVEHVHGFMQVTQTGRSTAAEMSQCILQALQQYKDVELKLVSQTYDGAVAFGGTQDEVQKLIRYVYPCAYFVHCYAHQLPLIMQQVCCTIAAIRIFFANLSAFSTFFTVSNKRTDLLNTVYQRRLLVKQEKCQTGWNFQSGVVSSVFQCKEALVECFEIIQEDDSWDTTSIRGATVLLNYLEDEEFSFFLQFFNRVMPVIDSFYNFLQIKITTMVHVKEHLDKFCNDIRFIRDEISNLPEDSFANCSISKKRKRNVNKKACAIECCDIIIQQAQERFDKTEHLECFDLVNPEKFSAMKCNSFPDDLCESCSKHYPIIESGKLKNELRIVYSSEEFEKVHTVNELYTFIIKNNLMDYFSETTKLSNIVLTTPVLTAESGRCFSTLERVKTYLRNTLSRERLNALAALAIEEEYISNIPHFNEKVISKFAEQKNRTELLFK